MKTNLKKQSKKYPKEYEVRHIKEQELEKTALSFLKDVNEIDVYNGNYMDNLINAHETIGEVFEHAVVDFCKRNRDTLL